MEDVDEDEEEEEVVVLGYAGCTVMRAGAGLWAAATSAAAKAGRMEGMSSGRGLGAGGWAGPAVTWRPGGPMRLAAAGEGGAGLRSPPSGISWARILQCVRVCGLVSAGEKSSRGLHSGAGGLGLGFRRVCAGGVCGSLGRMGVPWGAGLLVVGVCGLLGVGGGEGCSGGGSVAGVCGCLGGWGSPVWRGPGLRAMVGVRGLPGGERGGGGRGGDCVGGCVVSPYVSACSGAPVWSVIGRVVWRRSLLSSAAVARISQMSVRIWCTSWSVVGRGYFSAGLRSTRMRTLWMAWYLQVKECCGLGGGSFRVSGPASISLWAVGMDEIQGTVPLDGQRRLIYLVRQSMASAGWWPPRPGLSCARARAGGLSSGWWTPLRTLCRVVGSPTAPGGAAPGASMVLVRLTSHCGPGDVAVAATT